MMVKNAEAWSQQSQAFQQDETGRQFENYMLFWTGAAEKLMEESEDGIDPYTAAQEGLRMAEEHVGPMDWVFLGTMMAFIITHWIHGDRFGEGLTRIEIKIVASAIQDQAARMQDAAMEGNDQNNNFGGTSNESE